MTKKQKFNECKKMMGLAFLALPEKKAYTEKELYEATTIIHRSIYGEDYSD